MVPLSICFLRAVQLFFIYSFNLLFQTSKSKTGLQKLKTTYFILYVSLQVVRKPICTLCFQNSSICELGLSNASCDLMAKIIKLFYWSRLGLDLHAGLL